MPYRLQLFSGDLLISTTEEHETTESVGRQLAEYPLGEFTSDEGGSEVRYEVVYRDAGGNERPLTLEEEGEVFAAYGVRMAERGVKEMAPCGRCGRKAAEHEHLYPVRSGSIYFDCWTEEEREKHRAQGFPTP